MKPSDLLLLVVGPLTMVLACPQEALSWRGGASGCIHGGSSRRHGLCFVGFPLLPAEEKEEGGAGEGAAMGEEVTKFGEGAEV